MRNLIKLISYKKLSVFWLSSFLMIPFAIKAAETVAPADPTWGLDPVTGTLLTPGVTVNTMGTLAVPRLGDGDHSLKMFDVRSATLSNLRPVQNPDTHLHHHWDAGSIGNVYGLAIDNSRNIYTTASTHYGSYYGFETGNEARITFGSIGAGVTPDTAAVDTNPGELNDLSAAGAIYKIDAITGDARVFATLPQTATSITHRGCELTEASGFTAFPPSIPRNTGPALGNVAYDKVRNNLYISNFEDGRIYLFDAAATLPASGLTASDAIDIFDPVGYSGLTSTDQASPYGLAVSPDGTKLYYGTHEINKTPRLFAINLAANGTFVGSEIDQNAQLGNDLQYTQDLGGVFSSDGSGETGGDVWVSYSDLNFSPDGELIIGLRTGCDSNIATSHNHGGAFYLLKQDAGGLYNTPADKVPGTGTTYTGIPDTSGADPLTRTGEGRYDAGSLPIYSGKSGVGANSTGPDDGYGGVAIYDKGDGTFDYLVTSSDMTEEAGPHGFMLFPHDFTLDTSSTAGTNLLNPLASFPSLPSSDTAFGQDYKGVGGDIEVLSVLVDWGDAPDSYSTDLITGNATGGADVKGPTHIITSDGILLGTTVDNEFNGVPSVGADGDDNASTPDDEDGISAFPALNIGDTDYTIPLANISAANSSSGPVTIHAWIDFDGNGTFDSDEYTTTTVAAGATVPDTALSWTGAGVSNVTAGTTYARFRITNDTNINANTPAGPAANGEVEDYAITVPVGSWSGNVSRDDDNDDTGDTNLENVEIELFTDPNGDGDPSDGVSVGTQNTDSDGNYSFTNLVPGDYVAVETQPTGLLDVSENEGGVDDDKPDNNTLNSIAGTVDAGENDANNDFVEELPGSWSGNVSRDDDNDDTGDTNLENVIIELFTDPNGDGDPEDGVSVGTDTTDSDGNYSFTNLAPGDYVAVETQPVGLLDVSENEGGADDDKPDNSTLNSIAGTVDAGENDANNDFVEEAIGTWSGNVSRDDNNDDIGDTNLENVEIQLFTDPNGDGNPADGSLVGTTQTGADGNYSFTNLSPGDYVAVETQPAGLLDVTENEGGADNDKPNNTLLNSIAGTVDAGENDVNNDFVEELPGSWSGNVSRDDDNDDTGDTNLENVTITLYTDPNGDGNPVDGSLVDTQQTDKDGNYSFTNLVPGDYVAVETQPAGLIDVSENEGGLDNDKPDNSTVNSIAGTVAAGENDANNDFVEEAPGSWSGNVSRDDDNDDTGDTNLENVVIELFTDPNGDGNPSDGVSVGTQNTDSDGNYSFTNLAPGDYVAVETQPAGLLNVSENEGGADNDKPNNNLLNSIAGTVATGEADVNNDFVEELPGSWSGNVSRDDDNDDTGDTNLENVEIELFTDPNGDGDPSDGVSVGTQNTDSDGNYSFTNLVPGDYVAVETQPTGLLDVSENEGGVDDDKPDNNTLNSIAGTVDAGENDANNDFVEELPGSWSGNVSRDDDNDDTGDTNLENVEIELFTDPNGDGDPSDGQSVGTTQTDSDGNYSFTNLAPGDYVAVETQPVGLLDVSENEGGADNDKPDNSTLNSIAGTVDAGENDVNNDFVEEAIGTWSGNVSRDDNNDDIGDTNLENVEIQLFTDPNGDGNPADGTLVGTTQTGADGNYSFTNLSPGDYVAVETQPTGLLDVSENEGGADNDKPNNTLLNSIAGTVDAGENDVNNDFVEELPGSWSGNVSRDDDNDDTGDTNLENVTITLYTDPNGDGNPVDGSLVDTQQTDKDGNYSFTNLVPGDYVAVETQPAGLIDVSENEGGLDNDKPDNSTVNSIAGTVAAGENDANNDFVEEAPGSWSGNVSRDDDNDDTGDTNLENVVIELFTDPNGDGNPSDGVSVGTQNTDSDGNYSFTNLAPGDYVAVETQPAGLLNVSENEGGADNDKPNNNLLNSIAGTVATGEADVNNDFVEELPGSWSGNVSRDDDNDDTGDTNLENVEIELFTDPNGDGDPSDGQSVGTTQTDSDGNYSFTNLVPGDYVAVETQPTGLLDVSENEGGVDDDKPDNNTLNSIAGTVDAGENDANNDFVEELPGSWSGNVSRDDDNDDTGDTNLENVIIELFTDPNGDGDPEDGVSVGTDTTDSDGNYSFTNLAPGDYVAVETQPVGLLDVSENEGGADDDKPDNSTLNSIAGTVDAGENDANNDFVEEAIGTWSGNVSRDDNNDDIGDTNLENVEIQLFTDPNGDGNPADGSLVGTTQTGADGNYSFTNLSPGDYVAVETQPAGLLDVTENEGGADNDKPNNTLLNSIAGTVDAGENDVNNDFVEELPGSWSGNVSRDDDNDDTGDTNLENVTITLYTDPNGDGNPVDGSLVDTQQTDKDGNYSFTNLVPGDYVAVETQPAGLIDVSENEGGLDNDKPDNSTVNSIAGTVAAGENDANNDFVEEAPGSWSGNVSRDDDNDDTGDTNLENVVIELFTDPNGDGNPSDGVSVGTQNTDSDGNYSFTNLAPGDYVAVETQPAGLLNVSENEGGADNDKPNNNLLNSIAGTVATGEADVNNDFVEELPGSWSGNVSRDDDNDDTGDTNLENVEIELFTDPNGDGDPSDGVSVGTQNTDSDGNYSFTNLVPGDYVAVETQPTGLLDVSENEGGVDDDKPDNNTLNSIAGTVDAGENDANNDFVEELPGSWSGNVSRDDDNDDTGDTNLENVEIELFTDPNGDGDPSDGQSVGTTQTDSDGNYSFTNLAPGDYVAVETQPVGLLDVSENEGGADNDKPDNSTLNSIAGTVDAGENDVNNDFVEEAIGTWSGNVSRDDNNDDIGDTNLENVEIQLFTDPNGDGNPADGTLVGTTQTGADGNYSFTNLSPGDYVAVETQPTGLLDVSENEGGADNDKPNNTLLNSIAGTVDAGENDVNNDFVEELPGSWSGNVSRDDDNDDTGDTNLENVTITLYTDPNGDGNPADGTLVATTQTGADGNYSFTNLVPGDYVAVETQPAGLIDVSENEGGLDNDKPDNSTLNSIAGTIDAGETDSENNFVEELPSSIGNTVWYDSNGNGIEDDTELGVEDVTVYLLDESGTRIPGQIEVTDASGNYEFTNLPPGTYSVEFNLTTLPSGYEATLANQGGDETSDSDADPLTGITESVTVQPGENNPNIDMGIFQKVSLGSTVFIDRNNNGLQDADETGIEGVTMQLFNAGDDPTTATPIDSMDTDTNGDYLFTDLIPGSYFVYIPEPPIGAPGSSTDIATSNADNQVDGDDNGQQTASGNPVQSPNIVLSVGTEPTDGLGATSEKDTGLNTTGLLQDNSLDANGDMTVDFGFVPSSIGDTIWHDVDYSGGSGPNAGDIPLANVTVILTPPSGVGAGAGIDVELTTTTDSNGMYIFELLPPGEYTITVDTGTGDLGANPDLTIFVDPDSVKNSVSTYDLGSGEQNTDQDFAYANLGGVSGNVSEDIDSDGIGDEPMPNVVLQLLDNSGQPVLQAGNPVTTTTDDDGNYSFMSLIPGDYQIAQIQPLGFSSVSDVDGNDQNNMIGDATPIGVTAGNVVPAQDFVEVRGNPQNIPTLSEWALILLMMMLGFVGHRQSTSQKLQKRAF